MAYQTPQLTLVGSATGLVLGNVQQDIGVFSDNSTVQLPLQVGNSRYSIR